MALFLVISSPFHNIRKSPLVFLFVLKFQAYMVTLCLSRKCITPLAPNTPYKNLILPNNKNKVFSQKKSIISIKKWNEGNETIKHGCDSILKALKFFWCSCKINSNRLETTFLNKLLAIKFEYDELIHEPHKQKFSN